MKGPLFFCFALEFWLSVRAMSGAPEPSFHNGAMKGKMALARSRALSFCASWTWKQL